MKLKRLFLSLLAVCLIASAAIAQTVLLPSIRGTYSEHQADIGYFGMVRLANNTALTATAGGAQAGTALNLGINRFTTVATGGDSAQLPQLSGGIMIVVINAAASNSMNVFGQTGQTINALSANAAFAVAAGKTAIFFQGNDGNWYAVLTA